MKIIAWLSILVTAVFLIIYQVIPLEIFTTIVITMLVSDKGGMSITYEKTINEDGTFTYTFKTSQIM